MSTELTRREEKGETVQRQGDGDKNRGQEPALTKTETERQRSEIDKSWESPRGERDWVGEVPKGEKRVGREPEGVKEHPPFGGSCRPSPPLCLPCSSPSSVTSESPTPSPRARGGELTSCRVPAQRLPLPRPPKRCPLGTGCAAPIDGGGPAGALSASSRSKPEPLSGCQPEIRPREGH